MNFGEIKHTYNSLLAESLSNNLSDGKVAFKKYIKSIPIIKIKKIIYIKIKKIIFIKIKKNYNKYLI